MTAAMDEIMLEFISEAREGLDGVESDLLALETTPDDAESIDAVFRTVHSIKGTAGLLGLGQIESVAHSGETLMTNIREGSRTCSTAVITALLDALDILRTELDSVESTGAEHPSDHAALCARLEALAEFATVDVNPVPVPPPVPTYPEPAEAPTAAETPADPAAADVFLEFLGPPPGAAAPAPAPSVPDLAAALAALGAAAPAPKAAPAQKTAPAPKAEESGTPEPTRRDRRSDAHVRVDVRVLDQLMNLVGELVLVRNRMLQATGSVQDSKLVQSSQQLDLITTELQEGVMKTRMQTVGTVLTRLPRVVRDLCLGLGKDVAVEIEGQETELDRTVIEAIKDPLTHLVRNAVDHGVETPDERLRAGKPAQGTLSIRAFHEGGQVNIEIRDDGKGIDIDRVCDRALDRGIVTQAKLARMSPREIMDLIFQPGFSTAEAVTNVSGRGVGMDVVRTHIEKIGGTVEVSSTPGQGTSFLLRIPLTLAIIPTLLITTSGARYAVPQVSLVELVRVEAEQHDKMVADIGGVEVLRLRGQLLPLVHLDSIFGTPSERPVGAAMPVVVLQAGRTRFGLVVDEINDTEEIVVKPLGRMLKGLHPYAGATILGDGSVALILDVPELARTANLAEPPEEMTGPVDDGTEAGRTGPTCQLLTFFVGEGRMALPLDQVARLEDIPASRVEWTAGRPVLQYRDDLLPLVFLGDALGIPAAERGENLKLLVCRVPGGTVGLVVDRIADIVEQEVEVIRENPTAPRALPRTAVIEGRVTDLLDVPALLDLTAVPLFTANA